MNFESNDDLRAFQDAVDRLVNAEMKGATLDGVRFHHSAELERRLEAAGFFGCLDVEELGRTGAASMVMALSRLPVCAEIVASAMIAPRLCSELPCPYAVVWEGLGSLARFLPVARTVIAVRGASVEAAVLGDADEAVQGLDSLFAYPLGRLRDPSALRWQAIDGADACALRDAWRVGVAAEIVGCLDAGLKAVVEYVKQRHQFGRPLGAFQAIQHRLAECATAIESARWLTLKAADTEDPLDAAVCIGFAQQAVARVSYDLHQFMGAMGLTLEHPLHRWTYRARLLRSDLGGADRHFVAVARAAWEAAPRMETTG